MMRVKEVKVACVGDQGVLLVVLIVRANDPVDGLNNYV